MKKSNCLNLAANAANAIEEILVVLDTNSQELSQMRTNIINDLQKYHREGWLMIRNYHYEFVFQNIRDNIVRGRKEGLYRENFDVDIVSKLHLATAFNIFDEQVFPEGSISRVILFKECMMHFLFGIVSPKGLNYLKKKLG